MRLQIDTDTFLLYLYELFYKMHRFIENSISAFRSKMSLYINWCKSIHRKNVKRIVKVCWFFRANDMLLVNTINTFSSDAFGSNLTPHFEILKDIFHFSVLMIFVKSKRWKTRKVIVVGKWSFVYSTYLVNCWFILL